MSLSYTVPDAKELQADAANTLELAVSFTIDSQQMYELAGGELKEISAKLKALESKRKAITGPLDKAKKEVMDLFRGPLATLEQAESAIKTAMLSYQSEQRRIAAEQQAAIDKAAKAEAARLEKQAETAQATGDVALAATLQATAAVITAPVVQAEPAKVSGISSRETWKAIVTDKLAFVQHVAANPELIDLLLVDQKAIDAMARALKANLNLPGITAQPVESIAVRA